MANARSAAAKARRKRKKDKRKKRRASERASDTSSATTKKTNASDRPAKRAKTSSPAVAVSVPASDEFLVLPPSSPKTKTTRTRAASSPSAATTTTTPSASTTPWIVDPIDASLPPILRLHEEILDFCAFVSPTSSERSLRSSVESRMRDLILSIYPTARLVVFGSSRTNLALPTSDVDMCVFDAHVDPASAIEAIASRLTRAADVERITKARVPILKFRDISTNLSVDICFDQESGVRTARYASAQLRRYPALRPLILTVKYFLAQRDLNETYRGGFGSFLIFLLVLAYLQRVERAFGERLASRTNLGALLLGLLRFYGRELNAVRVGLSVRKEGSYFDKIQKDWSDARRPQLLSVENPDEPDADVGRNSWAVVKVRGAMLYAYHAVRDASLRHGRENASLLRAMIVPDETLLSRAHQRRLAKKT